ncbi:MAG: methionyl-tRNA formyltransferase [Pseudomonadota bacterium]
MLTDAILLTGEREHASLKPHLMRSNPSLNLHHAVTEADLRHHLQATQYQARLIAFTTGVIVPEDILNRLEKSPYNFHPGPPHVPGRYPEAWGVYFEERRFGATAHVMHRLVDAGPIVDVEWFDVPAAVDRFDMAKLCFTCVSRLFVRLAPQLATATEDLPIRDDLAWTGRKWRLADYEELRDNPPCDDDHEAARRLRSFGPPVTV